MQNTPEIRKWIQEQLRLRSWTRADLAKAAGTTQSMWSRIFSGETKRIQDTNIKSLCEVFDVDRDQLFAISHGKIFARAQKKAQCVAEPPSPYQSKWDRLAAWTAMQPEPIKKALAAVAESHGWEG